MDDSNLTIEGLWFLAKLSTVSGLFTWIGHKTFKFEPEEKAMRLFPIIAFACLIFSVVA